MPIDNSFSKYMVKFVWPDKRSLHSFSLVQCFCLFMTCHTFAAYTDMKWLFLPIKSALLQESCIYYRSDLSYIEDHKAIACRLNIHQSKAKSPTLSFLVFACIYPFGRLAKGFEGKCMRNTKQYADNMRCPSNLMSIWYALTCEDNKSTIVDIDIVSIIYCNANSFDLSRIINQEMHAYKFGCRTWKCLVKFELSGVEC